ncbi:MAG: class I SAM-dependent methyltransferase [Candidatus Dormiibacterota bacterium]
MLSEYEGVEDPSYLAEEENRLRNSARVVAAVERHRRPGTLFEVGASVGILLEAARRRGWTVSGIEPSRWAVATGRHRYGVNLRQGTIEGDSGPNGPVDCVVMSDVLEHLIDPQGALLKAAGWLAPEGVLAIVTVNMTALLARALGTRRPGYMDMHLTYFSPQALDSMFSRAGLTRIAMGTAPRRLSAGYLGERLRGSGRLTDVAAQALRMPLVRRTTISLRSRDLLLVLGRRLAVHA